MAQNVLDLRAHVEAPLQLKQHSIFQVISPNTDLISAGTYMFALLN